MWDTVIVGKCASCGGVVSRPRVWVGLNRPSTTCENCGSQMDETANLPVVPTIPGKETNGYANPSYDNLAIV
jgi:uncharacterized protein (DUF983 family)